MPNSLSAVPELPRDEAFALTADFKADPHPKKAKDILHETANLDHEYLPIYGSQEFLDVARDLILGHYDESKCTVVSVQTISGTGANHLGAVFLAEQLKPRHVFFSDPTWSNHHLVWEVAAPQVIRKTYPYYCSSTQTLDFECMMTTLESEAVENDVVVLHACAHNPTGIDPTKAQWKALAQLFKHKKLFAFFDSAYQGFATGDVEADAWAVRHFQNALFKGDNVSTDPQGMCVAQSFAKNFGLYGERVGAFHLVLQSKILASGPKSQLLRLVRAEMSNPPLFGSRVVHAVLSSPKLRTMWMQDLQTMSSRIKRMRLRLRDEIEKHLVMGSWSHLEHQVGMFSYTGLDEEQVLRMREVHHVYLMLSGRASISGVNDSNVKYVADAFTEVLQYKGK